MWSRIELPLVIKGIHHPMQKKATSIECILSPSSHLSARAHFLGDAEPKRPGVPALLSNFRSIGLSFHLWTVWTPCPPVLALLISGIAAATHKLLLSSPPRTSSSQRFVTGLGPVGRRFQLLHAHIVPARGGGGLTRAMASGTTPSELSKVAIKRNGNGETVAIKRTGDVETVFDAYVAGSQGAPGIVVVQEWWGVDFEIKNHALAIAKKGYRVLIPDLYRGKVGLDAAEAHHLFEGLDWQGAVKDVDASVKWLKEDGSPKVGVTGFCMGGALTLASAVLVPGVDAGVAFYGTPDPGLADVSKVKVPVQAHFGEADGYKGFSDVETAKALEEKLKVAGVPSEVFIYPGQGHAFMNSSEEAIKRKKASNLPDHDQKAVDLAWSRFDAWFDKYLKWTSAPSLST